MLQVKGIDTSGNLGLHSVVLASFNKPQCFLYIC